MKIELHAKQRLLTAVKDINRVDPHHIVTDDQGHRGKSTGQRKQFGAEGWFTKVEMGEGPRKGQVIWLNDDNKEPKSAK